MNQPRLVRYLPDDVGGFRQGALMAMFDGSGLGNGNHRLTFGPDGLLWVAKTYVRWPGDEGLVRITPDALDRVLAVTAVNLEPAENGHQFRLTLSRPVAEGTEKVTVNRFDYHYHETYGSPKIDETDVPIRSIRMENDGRELIIGLTAKKAAIHQFNLGALRTADRTSPTGTALYYPANELP